jgi:ABC-type oligopeptide transport system substrate-binding subunit
VPEPAGRRGTEPATTGYVKGTYMSQKRLLALVGVFAIMAAACGGSSASSPPAASGSPGESPAASGEASGNLAADQVLRLYLTSEDPKSLDPALAEQSNDIAILHSLNRGLLYFDKDQNIVPALATEMPKVSEDGLTYTFTLRDAKYSNGDPIVADDLVYAWKRLIDPRIAATYQAIIADVEGGQAILDLPKEATDADIQAAVDKFGVSAPDPKTFVVKLQKPTGYFVDLATLWGTAPYQKKWVETPNFTEPENYVSSGPFILKSWSHQAEIVLAPNPNWYGTKPTLQEIRYHIGGDPAASQLAFEAGEYDMLKAPPDQVPTIMANPELGPITKPIATVVFDYWGFDSSSEDPYKGNPHKVGPTANRHFRRALAMAVDKDTLLATAYGGQGQVAGSPIPPGIPGYQEDIGLKYDVEAAKGELTQALQELGVSDVSQLPVLSFGFNTDAGHDVPAAFMQDQWQTNLGVKSELKGVTFEQFTTERPLLGYSIARNAWGLDYPHPDNVLRVLFHSQSGNNDEGYNNPEYDKLIEQAGAMPLEEALPLYNQAQEMLVEDAPAVFTRWRVSNYEVRPWVTGADPTAQDSENYGDLFFENVKILEH